MGAIVGQIIYLMSCGSQTGQGGGSIVDVDGGKTAGLQIVEQQVCYFCIVFHHPNGGGV